MKNLLTLLVFLTYSSNCFLQNFSSIVSGVNSIVSDGTPGILARTQNSPHTTEAIAGTGGNVVAFASVINTGGRMVVSAHGGFFTDTNLDNQNNKQFMLNITNWLTPLAKKKVLITNAYQEWVNPNNLTKYIAALNTNGYTVVTGAINAANLSGTGMVLVGDAWGTMTTTEFNLLNTHLQAGNGVFAIGLGWSWPDDLNTYNMNIIAAMGGIKYVLGYNSATYTTFYPNVLSYSFAGAKNVIDSITTLYPSTLPSVLQNTTTIRDQMLTALNTITSIMEDVSTTTATKLDIYNFYKTQINKRPNYFKSSATFNKTSENNMIWIKYYVQKAFRDAQDLTSTIRTDISNTLGLSGRYLDIWNTADVILADNNSLDIPQKEYLNQLFIVNPKALYNLGIMTFSDFLGTNPFPTFGAITLPNKVSGAINSFSTVIGTYLEFQFPVDISVPAIDIFCAAAPHELHHVIDALQSKTPSFQTRKTQLISQAGTTDLQYLRSMVGGAFFVANPQEFVASMANMYINDTKKVFELARSRFNSNYKEPMNQALFMAQIHSSTTETYFYNTTVAGVLTKSIVPITRDVAGHINSMTYDAVTYNFTREASSGNVMSISTGNNNATCSNNLVQNPGFENGLTGWQGAGYTLSTIASNGTNSVRLCSGSNILNGNTIPMTAGKSLTLTFKARSETGSNNVLGYIKYLSNTWQPIITEFYDLPTTTTFTTGTITKLSPTNTTYVEIGFLKETAGCTVVDDVCLSENGTTNPCDNDIIAPILSACPTNINLITTGTSAIATWTPPTATDNCGTPTVTTTANSGSSFNIGTTMVTYTATDIKYNTSTCAFNVTVTSSVNPCTNDIVPPVLSACPSNISLTTTGTSAIATWAVPTASDNCGTPSIASTANSGASFNIGTTTVTYTATDAKGNKATCSFTVTVTQTTTGGNFCISPTANVKDNGNSILITGITSSCAYISVFTSGWSQLSSNQYTGTSVTIPNITPGNYIVKVKVLGAGCTWPTLCESDVNVTVTSGNNPCVNDIVAPVLSACPTNISLITTGTSAIAIWTPPTATDNCGTPTLTSTANSGSSFNIGTTIVTYTATDTKGNKSTCAFNVLVTGVNNGSCAFVKTYLPVPLSLAKNNDFLNGYKSVDILQPLNLTATGIKTWIPDNNGYYGGGTSKSLSISTDIEGNLINSTDFISSTFVGYANTLQTSNGDFVNISTNVNGFPNFEKKNAAGLLIWNTSITQYINTTTTSPYPQHVIQDGKGFLAIFNLNANNGTTNTREVILIKVDANGVYQWQKVFTGQAMTVVGFSADGIFGNVTTDTGRQFYKFNRTNGSILWMSSTYAVDPFFDPVQYQHGVVTSDGNLLVALRNVNLSILNKYNGTTGALISTTNLTSVSGLIGADKSFIKGMFPTNDGGVIISGSFNATFTYDSVRQNKIYKLNTALSLVWQKNISKDWNIIPKAEAADGGILFVGLKNNDYAILKSTAVGDFNPLCSNSCYISKVTISNIVCNNNGTDTDPLDDTYSYDVLVVQNGNCTTGGLTTWVGDGTSGFFGVVQKISGKKIDDGERYVTFSDASNALSTVYSEYLSPPAFCSNTGVGCGYDKPNSTFTLGILDSTSLQASTLPNGNIQISGQNITSLPNRNYKEMVIDNIGNTVSSKLELVTSGTRTTDGNYVVATYANNNIVFKKSNADGSIVIFNKNIVYNPGQSVFSNPPTVRKIVQVADGYLMLLSFEYQTTPNTAPLVIYGVIKTDLNGNKLYSYNSKTYNNYPDFFRDVKVANNGDVLLLRSTTATIYLDRYKATTGDFLWTQAVLGDFPSSRFTDYHESADGNIYVTRYDNSFGYVRKLDGNTGIQLWQYSSAYLPIPNNSTVFGYPNGTLPTSDGGIVFSMGYSLLGNGVNGMVYGRLSKSGQLIWHRTLPNTYQLFPVLNTTDGGFLFIGKNGTNFELLKTNSIGDITPTCTNGTTSQPDLTLTNLNVTGSSVAVGGVLNFKYDLKNIGNAAATGNFTIKSYLSTDNVLSANDIQNGSVPTGNLAAGQSVLQVAAALTVPNGTPAGNYYVIVKADADNQITESNENNNVIVSNTTIAVTTVSSGNKPDLSLNLTANPQNPGQWKTSVLTLTITNSGTVAATGVKIDFMNQSNPAVSSILAYQSFVAPSGTTYDNWIGVWTIPTINPGQSYVMTYNSFTKLATSIPVFAQVKTQSPADADSNPGNNTTGIPAEDDEALVLLNANNPAAPNANIRTDKSLDWYEGDKEINVQVYPNPSDGIVNIYINKEYFKTDVADTNLETKATLVIYNSLGVEVIKKEIKSTIDVEQIELDSVPSGSYYIWIAIPNKKPLIKKLTLLK